MGYLINLYINLLKSHPIKTNLGTALVLMVGGDVLAQEIERYHLEDAFTFHPHDLDGVPPSRRLHLRPYGLVEPDPETNKRRDGGGGGEDGKKDGKDERRSNESNGDSRTTACPPTEDGVQYEPPWPTAAALILDSLWSTLRHNDWTRTVTMGGWAVGFYTPAYMLLYSAYDRVFPKKNAATVLARVAGAVVYSIPVNAAFFIYGTCVHHTLEWYRLWDALQIDAEEEARWDKDDVDSRLVLATAAASASVSSSDGGGNDRENDDGEQHRQHRRRRDGLGEMTATMRERLREHVHRHFFLPLPDRPPPYDVDMMLSKARLKIDTELTSTVTNSAKMWIPINLLNFAAVPAHLRPFGLLFFSVFWNCYLSLVQHRDVPLPEE